MNAASNLECPSLRLPFKIFISISQWKSREEWMDVQDVLHLSD